MNFHFVDRILTNISGKYISGLKHVTSFDTYLTQNHAGETTLMSCIVGEAIGQLCSWNVIKATNGKLRSVAGIVSEVRLLGEAKLGDTIELEVHIEHLDDQAVTWHGQAKVDGKLIVQIESSVGPCLPMEDFNTIEEVLHHLNILERPGEYDFSSRGTYLNTYTLPSACRFLQYDKLLELQKGESLLAEKNVSILSPFFADHFPLKPVFPVSLLLQAKLQLGQYFLEQMGLISKDYYPLKFGRIKISEFIRPGDSFSTQVTLRQQTENQIILSYKSTLHEKRFCVAEVEFIKVDA